jgi:hypothetical protein
VPFGQSLVRGADLLMRNGMQAGYLSLSWIPDSIVHVPGNQLKSFL